MQDHDFDLPRGNATFKVFQSFVLESCLLTTHKRVLLRGKLAVTEMWQKFNTSQALSGRMGIELACTPRETLVLTPKALLCRFILKLLGVCDLKAIVPDYSHF